MTKQDKKPKMKKVLTGLALFKFCLVSLYMLGDSLIPIISRFQQMFGAVALLFGILMIMLMAETLQLLVFRSCSHKNLELVEFSSIPVGMMGTVIGLILMFSNYTMEGKTTQEGIVFMAISIGICLKTTLAGLILERITWIVRARLAPMLQKSEPSTEKKVPDENDDSTQLNTDNDAGTPELAMVELR
jgi:hypothetical protein